MQNMDVKKKVLEEIMGLMDEKEGDKLKSHPKLMAAKVEVVKPEMVMEEGSLEEEKMESPDEESKESDMDGLTPEMIQELLEKYESMK